MFWTILIVCCVMASYQGGGGSASEADDETGTIEMSQDDIFVSQVSTANRFDGFQARVGNFQSDHEWQVVFRIFYGLRCKDNVLF